MISEERIESIVRENLLEEMQVHEAFCLKGRRYAYDASTARIKIRFDLEKLGYNEEKIQRILN